MRRAQYLVLFGAGFLFLVSLAIWASNRSGDFRDRPIDFATLSPTELFIEQGMTRNQAAALKLGYIEKFDPPKVGMFGNHQFQYFSASAFGRDTSPRDFFNFWYANLSLTEVLDLLRYLESIDKLPTRTILVQMTTPNNDNGAYIIGYNGELLRDLVKFGARDSETLASRWTHEFQAMHQALLQVFNYSNVIAGLAAGDSDSRIIDTKICQNSKKALKDGTSEFSRHLPKMLRQMIGLVSKEEIYCDPVLWGKAFSNDGSHDGRYISATPVLNQNALDPKRIRLQRSDIPELVSTLKALRDLARRNDRKLVLVIPPVYETDRFSTVDRIVDDALSQVADLTVQDDRRQRLGQNAFINYDHPNHRYFSQLVGRLKQRGLVNLDQR